LALLRPKLRADRPADARNFLKERTKVDLHLCGKMIDPRHEHAFLRPKAKLNCGTLVTNRNRAIKKGINACDGADQRE